MRVPYEWLIIASIFAGKLASAQEWGPADPYTGYSLPSQNPLYADLLPADRALTYPEDFTSRVAINTKEMFRGTWGRLEYLHGNISHERPTLMGTQFFLVSPLGPEYDTFVTNPSQQFEMSLPNGTSVMAEVPSTEGIKWKDAQGIRGSFGIPVTKAFSIEGRLWQYEEQNEQLTSSPFPATSTAPDAYGRENSTLMLMPVTINGQFASFGATYDAGFASSYRSNVKAGDIALVFNWKNPDEGLRLQPIIGYRHEEYGEQLGFGGSFDNRSNFFDGAGILPTQSNWIQSNTKNQREMMELGLRSEFQKGFLTLGLQERIAFGSNIAKSTVNTTNVFYPGTAPGVLGGTGLTTSQEQQTTFAPSFDLDAYINMQVNRWLSLRVGYNLIWIGGIGAADRSIRFNALDDGTTITPDVVSNLKYSNRTISAFTIGGEIVLP